MIKDIINAFESKFYEYVKNSDAFNSKFISDEDSAIGILVFNSFNIEFEYEADCGLVNEKSGLNVIFDFSKISKTPLRCMMYDIVSLLDKNNTDCWFFCFIENEERMNKCFQMILDNLDKVLPKILDMADSPEMLKKLQETIRKNILTTVGIDIVKEYDEDMDNISDSDTNKLYDYLFSTYFGFEQTAFATQEYSLFLSGEWKKALKKYKKKKNKLVYEENIVEYIENNIDNKKPIIPNEYQSLNDGISEIKGYAKLRRFLCAWAVMFVPITIIILIMYYIIGIIIYASSDFATAMLLSVALPRCMMIAFSCSMISGFVARDRIYHLILKHKYKKLKDYDAISSSKKSSKFIRTVCLMTYILSLVTVLLFVNYGVSFSDNGVRDKTHFFSIVGKFHSYSEVDSLVCTADSNYCIVFEDGKTMDIGYFLSEKSINSKVIPIMKYENVNIIYEK